MRAIDGTPVDKIEQRFNVFATEINSINEKTQTDRKAIVGIQQQATNLARSLSESIEKFNKDIVQTETSLSQNITQKTNSLNESIKLVSDNLTNTQKELTSLIEKLNKGTTEITPEQLGARLALLEEWQTKIDQWKKLLIDEDTDNVINTLTEVLAFFKEVPKNVGTILDLLNKKVDKEDVYLKKETDNFLKNKIDKVRRINDGTDFNNIKETGFYYCDFDGTFNTLINRPPTNSGFLKVTGDNENWILQEWTMYNDTKRTFVRRLYAGGWTSWQEVGGGGASNKVELVGLLTYTASTGALEVRLNNTIAFNRFSVQNWSGGSVLVVMIDGVPCSRDWNSDYIALPFTGADMPISSQPYSIGIHGTNQFSYAKYGGNSTFTPSRWVSFLVLKYK